MNKNFLAIIAGMCLLLFAAPLRAQYMSLGPSVGGGISWLTYPDESFDQSPRFTWNAGATFVYSTESHLGFGADLKFSQEGTSTSYDVLGTQYDNTLCLNYLRLPLRAIYFFGDYGQSVRPKIFLGPTLGILLSANNSVDPGESVDVKDSFNTVDVGVHIGAGPISG